MEKFDFKKQLKPLYLPSDKDFITVDVPEMQFVMIDGAGSPQDADYTHAVRGNLCVKPVRTVIKSICAPEH
jgi:hypothetical protein